MKAKSSYLKLMLWTLAGTRIKVVLGTGMALLTRTGDESAAELIYNGAVRATVQIQLVIWLLTGGGILSLMNRAKKLAPLMEPDEEWGAEKKADSVQSIALTFISINLAIQLVVTGIGFDEIDPFAYWTVVLLLVSTVSIAYLGIAVINQIEKMNPMKQGDPGALPSTKAWEDSRGKARRLQIYRCGYRAFQVTEHSLLFGPAATIIGKVSMGTDSMSTLLLGPVFLIQNVSYGIYSLKQGNANSAMLWL